MQFGFVWLFKSKPHMEWLLLAERCRGLWEWWSEAAGKTAADCELCAAASLVADIGTDHALLPVYLAWQGTCSRIIATDLQAGPLEAARSNVGLFNLWKQVDLRQGDGLDIIQPGEVNVIIIAGMGGVKINEILGRAGKCCSR